MPALKPAFRPQCEQLEARDVPSADFDVVPFPAALRPLDPVGSLVFRGNTINQFDPLAAQFVTEQSGGLNRAIGMAFGPDLTGDGVGELYVSSFNSDEVMRYNGATAAPLGAAGDPDSAVLVTAGLGGLDNPEFLTFGPDGNLYVVSSTTAQVFRYNPATGALIDVFVRAADNGPLEHPLAATFGPDGNLYVTGAVSHNVVRFSGTTGAFLSTFVGAGSGGLARPETLAFGPDGNLYVASSQSGQVLRYNGSTGAFLGAFVAAGSGVDFPTGLAFGPDGHLYVGGAATDNVQRYNGTTGALIDAFVPPGVGGLDRPTALAFGADGKLYVSTADSSKVLRFDGTSGGPGDADSFTLDLDGGQTLTLRVASGVEAAVTLTHSVLGNIPLPADQDPTTARLYQTVAIPESGTLTVRLQAPNGYTSANYNLELTLNAFRDRSTGSDPLVQSLDGSVVDADPGAGVLWRWVATGSVEAAVPRILTETEGQTNDLRGSWDRVGTSNVWTVNNGGNPNTSVNKGVTGALDRKGQGKDSTDSWSFAARAGDVITLRTRASNSGGGTLTRATLTLSGPGVQVTGTAVPGAASDQQITFTVTQPGIYTAVVGTDQGKRGTYTLLADLNTPTDPRFRPDDVYSVTADASGRLSLAVATGGDLVTQPRARLALYAPGVDPATGTPLATSSSTGSLDGRIELTAAAGTYHVTVSPGPGLTGGSAGYGLVVVAGGSFEATGGNGAFATAQPIAATTSVLGAQRPALTTFIPSGSGGLLASEKLAFHNGDLFVVSRTNNTINRYDGTTGAPKPAPGKSGAVFANSNGLSDPIGIAFGPDGNLYVANYATNAVSKFNGATGAGMGTFVAPGSGGLAGATGLTFGPDGHLYVASRDSDRVMRYNGSTGAALPSAGNTGATFALGGGLDGPDDLTFGPDGRLYVSSQFTNEILAFDGAAGVPAPFVASGGGVIQPLGVCFGPDGNLYVVSHGTGTVLRYQGPGGASPGAFLDSHVPAGLNGPTGLTFGPDGALYVTSRSSNSVMRSAINPDYYAIMLTAGQQLAVNSATPFDGTGQPANALDPRLELFNAGQSLVASGSGSGNEQLVYTAPATGTYYLKVSAERATAGDYTLTLLTSQPMSAVALGSAAVDTSARANPETRSADPDGATLGIVSGEGITLPGVFVDGSPPADMLYVLGDEFDPLGDRRKRR